jgi:hypothetical protein
MKINVNKLCNLATNASWQTWLYHTDKELYSSFRAKILNSKGCSQNRQIMISVVESLKDKHLDKLANYMVANFPYMLDDIDDIPITRHKGRVFEFDPHLLTYPRRMIFSGSLLEIKRRINSFVLDKIKYDSIIVDGIGYVEYLLPEDKDITGSIPIKNWKIAKFRLEASECNG